MMVHIFESLWITIFAVVCFTIKRAVDQRARECRHAQRHTMRRFTGESLSRRRSHRRHAEAYQQIAA